MEGLFEEVEVAEYGQGWERAWWEVSDLVKAVFGEDVQGEKKQRKEDVLTSHGLVKEKEKMVEMFNLYSIC